VAQITGRPWTAPGSVDAPVNLATDTAVVPSLATLPLEQARERYRQTELRFALVSNQKAVDDRQLADARDDVGELRDEMLSIAESTVANAITSYRQVDLDQGLLEVEDLNSAIRASSLGDAALVADTTTFDRFHDKAKDLQIAEYHLLADEAENRELTDLVFELERRLQVEQQDLIVVEERALWLRTHREWVSNSLWRQQLGTKQGAYFLTCPVDGDHQFIDSWGFPRSGGRRHKGVDILARTGTPIVAPVSGTVSYRRNRVGGRSFHLYDERGNYFYGTHLSGYGDVEGEVRAGQVIGYVGDDGNAAGIPHLHLEIHPGGRGNPINPFPDSAPVCEGADYR
jgi:murein DD-endopeptidase MepM/ murein hydrolase activator NlpD